MHVKLIYKGPSTLPTGQSQENLQTQPLEAPEREICIVCREDLSDKTIVLPCMHRNFHFQCLITWLAQNNVCPLCKITVENISHGHRASTELSTFKMEYRPEGEDERPSFISTAQAVQAPIPTSYLRHRVGHEHRPSWAIFGQRIQSYAAPPQVGVPGGIAPSFRGPSIAETLRPSSLHARQPMYLRDRQRRDPPPQTDPFFERRKRIYRDKIYSKHVGSNRISGFQQEITATRFTTDPDLASRAKNFIRRELQVFEALLAEDSSFAASVPSVPDRSAPRLLRVPRVPRYREIHGNHEKFALHIMSILNMVDIQGSGGIAVDLLGDFLGVENARLFLHELHSWLRSPYTELATWDQHTQYGSPERRVEEIPEHDNTAFLVPGSGFGRPEPQVMELHEGDNASSSSDNFSLTYFSPSGRSSRARRPSNRERLLDRQIPRISPEERLPQMPRELPEEDTSASIVPSVRARELHPSVLERPPRPPTRLERTFSEHDMRGRARIQDDEDASHEQFHQDLARADVQLREHLERGSAQFRACGRGGRWRQWRGRRA